MCSLLTIIWQNHMSQGRRKNKTRCGSGGLRMRDRAALAARAEGGTIDLSEGPGPRAPVSWQTPSRTYAHLHVLTHQYRAVTALSCDKKKPLVFQTLYNGNLRSIQTRRALQNRARKEQVSSQFQDGCCIKYFQFHPCWKCQRSH